MEYGQKFQKNIYSIFHRMFSVCKTLTRETIVRVNQTGGRAATADPQELILLRSLFKGLPNNPQPSQISGAMGKYASFLAQVFLCDNFD